tara:strand:+ start:118 stop:1647 length:1530 start_codon:yes stop_codon:yes gene_type:complete
VIGVEMVRGKPVYGYQPLERSLCKVKLLEPYLINRLIYLFKSKTWYEAKINPVDRFMADHDISGGTWLRINMVMVAHREVKTDHYVKCSIKHVEKMVDHSIAPLRTISYDIEVMALTDAFPVPERDPVIQIAAHLWAVDDVMDEKVIFMMGGCAPGLDESIIIKTYEEEADMLREWWEFVNLCDADFIAGYNSDMFDMPYLMDRSKLLGIKVNYNKAETKCRYIKSVGGSKQTGERVLYTYNCRGLIVYDVMVQLVKSERLRSYALKDVARELLGDEDKDDVKYTEIPILQRGSDEDRRRLAKYCMQDAMLCTHLIRRKQMIINLVELARVIGTSLSATFRRGQSHKIRRKLLGVCCRDHPRNFYLNTLLQEGPDDDRVTAVPFYREMKMGVTRSFEGATVLEPLTGYHKQPVAVLDFKSLYPSIVQAHNISYDTILTGWEENYDEEDVWTAPNGVRFIKKHVHEGLLPRLLTDLLAARVAAKKQMKEATDPFEKAVFDGKQVSVYSPK